jgi:ribosomal protein S18 acetylase RimI-like enzyme
VIQINTLHPKTGDWPAQDIADFIRLNAAFNDVTLTPAQVQANLRAGNEHVILVELDGQACGFACLQIWTQVCYATPSAEVTELYVAPFARRHGVGKALMMQAMQMAREAGAHEIKVATGTDNAAAQALYRSLGFEEDDVLLLKFL